MIQLSSIQFVYFYLLFICICHAINSIYSTKDKKIISSFVCGLELASRITETLMFSIKKTVANIDVSLALMASYLKFYWQSYLCVFAIK